MRVVRPFDPWKSELCTCPEKFSFNPYTGCSHRCLYCYATYIPRFFELREKRNLLRNLEKDLRELPRDAVISMSNSSDPYPPVERERELTRKCIELMRDYDVKLLVVTKSDIVIRDLDLISEMRAAVCITITGLEAFEGAPRTERRIEAFRTVKDYGIPAILRFDPVIPGVNDGKLWIIEKCEPDHVVTSTLKLKRDAVGRLKRFEEIRSLLPLYVEKHGGYRYLRRDVRERVLRKIEEFCASLGISCAFCREGLPFKAASCDGQHLIRRVSEPCPPRCP
ncbi:MAG: radical SAM protein [Archaeoglobaceae archaeon]